MGEIDLKSVSVCDTGCNHKMNSIIYIFPHCIRSTHRKWKKGDTRASQRLPRLLWPLIPAKVWSMAEGKRQKSEVMSS